MNICSRYLYSTAIKPKSARDILDQYAPKVAFKAKQADLTTNEYLRRNLPRDAAAKTRMVEGQVHKWRTVNRSHAASKAFVSVPWLKSRRNGLLAADNKDDFKS
jgi:hypothetical protein